MSPEEDQELNAQLDQYSADGYIEPARSAYVAGTLSTRKKDVSLRHCCDYMALNQTITSFQESMNYCVASKAPSSLVKWTFNKVFFRFRFFPNMWMAQHHGRNLDLTNLRCFDFLAFLPVQRFGDVPEKCGHDFRPLSLVCIHLFVWPVYLLKNSAGAFTSYVWGLFYFEIRTLLC